MGATKLTNKYVRRIPRSSSTVWSIPIVQSTPKKRSIVAILEKDKGTKASTSKKPAYDMRKTRQYPVLPPFLCAVKKAAALLEQWVKYQVINLPKVEYPPSLAYQKGVRYCPYHRRMVLRSSNASTSEGFSMRSKRREKSCSKWKQLVSMTSHSPTWRRQRPGDNGLAHRDGNRGRRGTATTWRWTRPQEHGLTGVKVKFFGYAICLQVRVIEDH